MQPLTSLLYRCLLNFVHEDAKMMRIHPGRASSIASVMKHMSKASCFCHVLVACATLSLMVFLQEIDNEEGCIGDKAMEGGFNSGTNQGDPRSQDEACAQGVAVIACTQDFASRLHPGRYEAKPYWSRVCTQGIANRQLLAASQWVCVEGSVMDLSGYKVLAL
eukprot:562242-Pelagomonas_calceolata.AAC.1